MGRRRRHTPEQIIRKLAEGNKLLAGGAELEAVCRHLEIAESTWHRWIAQYGGMKANTAAGRLAGLPYTRAAMSVDAGSDGSVRYRGRRVGSSGARYDLTVRPGPSLPDAPDPVS